VIGRRSWLALAGLLVLAPLLWAALKHVQDEERVWALVRASVTAHERTGYVGEAEWQGTRWAKRVDVVHDASRGLTRYRWIHGGFSVVTAGPNSRTPDPAAWCLDLEALERNYRAHEEERTRFLDREARVVRLVPVYEGRPEVTLTLDAETLLPLRFASRRPDGKAYRVAAFVYVRFGPQEVERRRSRRSSSWLGTPVSAEHLDETAGFAVLAPAYLPAGFRCIERRVKERSTNHVTLVYSDGVTAFELSQWIAPTPAQLEVSFGRRMGERGAARMKRWILDRRLRMLAESGQADAVVHRCRRPMHRTYDLHVAGLDVKLTSRADLAEGELLKVLRSLTAHG